MFLLRQHFLAETRAVHLLNAALLIKFLTIEWWHDDVKIDASIVLDAKYDQRYKSQASEYPALSQLDTQDFFGC